MTNAVEQNVGNFCPRCATETKLQERIDEAIKEQFGKITKDRSKEDYKLKFESILYSLLGGSMKVGSLFFAANTILPEQYKTAAKTSIALYALGMLASRSSQYLSSVFYKSDFSDIKDRLKAHYVDKFED